MKNSLELVALSVAEVEQHGAGWKAGKNVVLALRRSIKRRLLQHWKSSFSKKIRMQQIY